MSQRCAICGRGPMKIFDRSKSRVATKRRQRLNLQTRLIRGKRIKICARCLKTLYKIK